MSEILNNDTKKIKLPDYLLPDFERFKSENDKKGLYVLLITWLLKDDFNYQTFDLQKESLSLTQMFSVYSELNEKDLDTMNEEEKIYLNYIASHISILSEEFTSLSEYTGWNLSTGEMFKLFENETPQTQKTSRLPDKKLDINKSSFRRSTGINILSSGELEISLLGKYDYSTGEKLHKKIIRIAKQKGLIQEINTSTYNIDPKALIFILYYASGHSHYYFSPSIDTQCLKDIFDIHL